MHWLIFLRISSVVCGRRHNIRSVKVVSPTFTRVNYKQSQDQCVSRALRMIDMKFNYIQVVVAIKIFRGVHINDRTRKEVNRVG